MPCHRCNGLMVPDHPLCFHNTYDALLSDFTPPGDQPMRCFACGNVEDAQILHNRAAQLDAQLRSLQDALWLEGVSA